MTSRTLRRRLHHGDVDGRRHEHLETSEVDSLNEPLLGNKKDDDIKSSEDYTLADILEDGRNKENLHWALLFSQLIAQWAQWLAEPEKNIDENTGQTNGLLSFCAMIITHNYPACNGVWLCYVVVWLWGKHWLLVDVPRSLTIGSRLWSAQSRVESMRYHAYGKFRFLILHCLWVEVYLVELLAVSFVILIQMVASWGSIYWFHTNGFTSQTWNNFTAYVFMSLQFPLPCTANIVLGSGSLIGRLLPFSSAPLDRLTRRISPPLLSPLQEARLKHLKQRLAVPFDSSFSEHQDALRQLWRLSYPDRDLPSLKSELWKDMGWQGNDPSTDFRGGGFISLENMIFFAKMYPEAFQNLLHKRDGNRSDWEYPFAVAGINISFMLVQMLDLQSGQPSTLAGIHFLELLAEDDMAFDKLFCIAFRLLDAQWLAKRASYMEFNDVLKSTRTQLERELNLEDMTSVKDLPAYNLLRK
ncbi:hypothetical protein M9H77_28341 [Catharanthus roseus]|uniref:Uncharacterized protein n=1 Tax=Catharanthus roseus TaxID=4058 RepID=A0ACC0AF32_CATRO|nr:hypothetical protein M9H77_28341 [Catharanthus roseus]